MSVSAFVEKKISKEKKLWKDDGIAAHIMTKHVIASKLYTSMVI